MDSLLNCHHGYHTHEWRCCPLPQVTLEPVLWNRTSISIKNAGAFYAQVRGQLGGQKNA
ncbi:MAG: hypothetical protein HN432_04690 [Gammaproteobacteria bacterium]|nr:hypothetical protein [Gammaproteobacteria bacterium]